MASLGSYIKHKPFLTRAFCSGMRPGRGGAHWACAAPGRAAAQGCPLMLAFLGQIRSRSHTAGFLNPERCCPGLFPLCLRPSPSPFLRLRQARELARAPPSLQSLPGVPCPGETATKECHHRERKTRCLCFIPHSRLPVMTKQPEISV